MNMNSGRMRAIVMCILAMCAVVGTAQAQSMVKLPIVVPDKVSVVWEAEAPPTLEKLMEMQGVGEMKACATPNLRAIRWTRVAKHFATYDGLNSTLRGIRGVNWTSFPKVVGVHPVRKDSVIPALSLASFRDVQVRWKQLDDSAKASTALSAPVAFDGFYVSLVPGEYTIPAFEFASADGRWWRTKTVNVEVSPTMQTPAYTLKPTPFRHRPLIVDSAESVFGDWKGFYCLGIGSSEGCTKQTELKAGQKYFILVQEERKRERDAMLERARVIGPEKVTFYEQRATFDNASTKDDVATARLIEVGESVVLKPDMLYQFEERKTCKENTLLLTSPQRAQ